MFRWVFRAIGIGVIILYGILAGFYLTGLPYRWGYPENAVTYYWAILFIKYVLLPIAWVLLPLGFLFFLVHGHQWIDAKDKFRWKMAQLQALHCSMAALICAPFFGLNGLALTYSFFALHEYQGKAEFKDHHYILATVESWGLDTTYQDQYLCQCDSFLFRCSCEDLELEGHLTSRARLEVNHAQQGFFIRDGANRWDIQVNDCEDSTLTCQQFTVTSPLVP